MPSRRTPAIALLLVFACMPGPSEAQGAPNDKQVVHAGNGALDTLAISFNRSINQDAYVPGKANIIEFLRFIRDDLRAHHPALALAPKADPADGSLEPFTALVTSPIPNCLAGTGVAWHPNGRYLYIATAGGNSGGGVCGLDFGADGTTMSAIPGSPFIAAPGTQSVAVDPSGHYLYTANFDSNTVSGFAIAENGALTPLPGSPYAAGAAPRVIAVDPKGRFLYVTNNLQTNPGAISGFAIDSDTGGLTPLAGSPFVAPQYTRALAIEPRGAYLYVSGSVNQAYAIDATSGALTAVGAGFGPPASSMTVDPTGRYLYATSGQDLVTGYRIGAGGGVTVVGTGTATGGPVSVAVSRTARFVYTANLIDGNISGFAIDDATGNLAPVVGSPFAAGENVFGLAASGSLWTAETWSAGAAIVRPIGVWGGKPPYAFTIASGTLPPGVVLDAALGLIVGRPTTAGTYPVTIQIADSAGGTATQAFTLSVTGGATLPVVATVVEYYNAALDHYFITWGVDEIAKLDAGTVLKGWSRTGKSFNTWISAQPGSSPICRYYIPPGLGDSHFFGRGTAECAATGASNPSFVLEDAAFMYMTLPAAGVCSAGMTSVYRVFSNRADANHRYTTERAVRDAMVAKGWLAEGDGPDLVVMCAP